MNVMLFAIVLLAVSGLGSLCLNRFVRLSNYTGMLGAVTSCALGSAAIFPVFSDPSSLALTLPWRIPYGSLSIAVDALGAVFLFPIFILSAFAALYGSEYLGYYYGKKNIGSAWFFFNILIASMVLVVTARNAVLFLFAWELMSISSFFLVLFEGEKKEVAKAGLIYLVATHIGTLFLLVMFVLLGNSGGSFDFAQWKALNAGILPSAIFILAVIGFGTKAGFMPMHIWLPEAHPAAPSHVSAVMSGVMIKTGIYGLIRILTFLGAPCPWWGYSLIAIGIVSGILGILLALAQRDLKRLLAYSSIENIGIITIGIGLGVLGMSLNIPVLSVLGFTGALLHVVNHAFFKGLLFLGAGVVLHATGTREMDVLGGLLKKMPVAGYCFLIAAAAICGLPPLNGFISEFLIYFASFKSIIGPATPVVAASAVIASLALIGGLAVACFTKVFGIVFLGEPRSAHCRDAREPGILIRTSMAALAVSCLAIALMSPLVIAMFNRVIADITGASPDAIQPVIAGAAHPMMCIVTVALCLCAAILLIAILRRLLLKGRNIETAPTWDCGYAQGNSRMQYTASSYSQPIVDFFKGILRTQKHHLKLNTYFPDGSSFKTQTPDMFQETVFSPLLKIIRGLAEKLTWFQHGRLQLYVLYIFLTLVALFLWKL